MVALLGPVLYAIAMSLIYGWGLEFVAVRSLRLDEDNEIPLPVTILVGVALLAGLLSIWSLFAGIGLQAMLAFTLLALLISMALRGFIRIRLRTSVRQLKSLGKVSGFILLGFVLFALYRAAAGYPPLGDTGLYHAEAIRWIETYGAAPGLANFYLRLGTNSAIFVLAAFWGFASLGLHSYQVAGVVITVSFIVYCLLLINKLRSKASLDLPGIVAAGLFVYLLYNLRLTYWMAFPGADLPATVVVWAVFLLMLDKIEEGKVGTLDASTVAVVILSVFAVTLKLSSLPLLIMGAYACWMVRPFWTLRRAASLALMSSAVIAPWLARSVVLTGYLFFPLTWPDIFHVDWKVPPDLAKDFSTLITAWARIPVSPTVQFGTAARSVAALPLSQWIPKWYSLLYQNDAVLLNAIVVCSLLCAASLIIQALSRSSTLLTIVRFYALPYAAAVVGSIFWFIQAPDPRFGYGFLVILLWLPLGAFIVYAAGLLKLTAPQCLGILQGALAVSLLVSAVVNLGSIPPPRRGTALLSLAQFIVPSVSTKPLDGREIYVPVNGIVCWYAAFPCTPLTPVGLQAGLHLRGSSFADGFSLSETGK